MTSENGWAVISLKDDSNVLDTVQTVKMDMEMDAVSSIHDLFEVIDDRARKCIVCSAVVKITAKSNWGMKQHFKGKHPSEWTSVGPRVSRISIKVNDLNVMTKWFE